MGDAMMDRPSGRPDGHLRVSDRERDEVVDLLAAAATDGRLTLDEYGERSGQALSARTRDELLGLTDDLGPADVAPRQPAERAPTREPIERLVAIFGSETRTGRWPVPARLESRAIFGECKIDLHEASLHSRVTVIDARAVFGSVDILVPDGVHVQMTGMSIFGSRSCSVREAPPGAPVVEVCGRAIFGEVKVHRPGWREGVRKIIDERLPG